MFLSKRTLSTFIVYRREFIIIFLSVIAIFLGISLYSYHPTDTSWFYYSSQSRAVQNWCGLVGAYSAALLFYLFGAASLLIIPLISFMVYALFNQRSWKDEWERILSLCVLILIGAALCNFHLVDFLKSPYPGGYVGNAIVSSLHYLFDQIGSALFLYTMLYVALVLLLRFSFIGIIHGCVQVTTALYHLICKYQIVQHMYWAFKGAIRVAIMPIVMVISFFKSMLNGSAFEDTDLVMPSDNELIGIEDSEYDTDYQHEEPITLWDDELVVNRVQASDPLQEPGKGENNTHIQTDASFSQKELHQENQAVTKLLDQDQMPEEHEGNKQRAHVSYKLPNLDIFIGKNNNQHDAMLKHELKERAGILQEKLKRFGVSGNVVSIKSGPVVTLFEYQPQIDTKLSKILALEDDLAMALEALSIRILAPIPGKSFVGFEVANSRRDDVLFARVVQSEIFKHFSGALPLVLGQDTIGNETVVDLARMPHLLIAGSTGSGKSVALNAMLISLLCARKPEELKLILIDPKRLEFVSYNDIAHLLFPIVTDPKQAVLVLRWVVKQMEERYEIMARTGARSIFDYNQNSTGRPDHEVMPFIVVIIDELADLMITVGREIEDLITRITQMARAAGIHMIVATQRPSVDVITGLIKVNFPSRISFRVTSRMDSRTILDTGGADKLLGRGDMLFLDSTTSLLKRIHGAYVSDHEIEQVAAHIKAERPAAYLDVSEYKNINNETNGPDDPLYQDVLAFLKTIDEVSISLLQRKFKIGYNRSARLIEMLETQGLILPAEGGKARKVLK